MKLVFLPVSSLVAFVGLAHAAGPIPASMPVANEDDMRRVRLEPEFASLFTNASFTRDPAYKKDLAELNEVIAAWNGNVRRSNSVKAAAAQKLSPHGRDYCVGYAWNPHRTRIFENRGVNCNVEGWTSLVSFSVPKKVVASPSLPKIDGCVGKAENPRRSMYFSDSTNCDRNGWTHDFSLATQTTKDLKGLHFFNVWQAWEPHRINFSNGGDDLTSSGWTYRDYIPAYTVTYPLTPSGIETALTLAIKAMTLFGKILPDRLSAEFSLTMLSLALRSLEHLQLDAYNPAQGNNIQSFDDIGAIQNLSRELMQRVVPVRLTLAERMAGGFEKNSFFVTIHLSVNGLVGGIVGMDENVQYGKSWIRLAITRSLVERNQVLLYKGKDVKTGRYRGFLYSTSSGHIDLGLE